MGRLLVAVGLLTCLFLPMGCGQDVNQASIPKGTPIVRVRILEAQQQVTLTGAQPPKVHTSLAPSPKQVNLARGTPVTVRRTESGWSIGSMSIGPGELTLEPGADGSLSVNNQPYHGRYRFVPASQGKFDVVNDVDVDSYLKGVVSKELLWDWLEETYKAQAIVARTYALYEKAVAGSGRSWDLLPDERSQVYGGINAETSKSRHGVEATAGVVVGYGSSGQEKIFHSYFSSCCGGISQSAADAFGDAPTEPLSDQNVGARCNDSPRFNWGPIEIRKDEFTRRIRAWGEQRNRSERGMGSLSRIDVQYTNRFGRPIQFIVTDARNARYSLRSEELRGAINFNASPATKLPSSFFKPVNDPDKIRFVDGHGAGHGVGLCQWCAEVQAEHGVPHEQIIARAFPRSRLVRAY